MEASIALPLVVPVVVLNCLVPMRYQCARADLLNRQSLDESPRFSRASMRARIVAARGRFRTRASRALVETDDERDYMLRVLLGRSDCSAPTCTLA